MAPAQRRLRAARRPPAARALVPDVRPAAAGGFRVRWPASSVVVSSVQRGKFFRTELFKKLLRAEPRRASRVIERFGWRTLCSLVEGARARPFRFIHEAELVYFRKASLEDTLGVCTRGRAGRCVVQHTVRRAGAGRGHRARRGGGELRFVVVLVRRVRRRLALQRGPRALAVVALVEGGRARAADEGAAALGGRGVVLVEAEGAAQRRALAARPARLLRGGVRQRRARRGQQAVQRQAAARARALGVARRGRRRLLGRRGQRGAAAELDEPEFVLEFALSLLFIHVFI